MSVKALAGVSHVTGELPTTASVLNPVIDFSCFLAPLFIHICSSTSVHPPLFIHLCSSTSAYSPLFIHLDPCQYFVKSSSFPPHYWIHGSTLASMLFLQIWWYTAILKVNRPYSLGNDWYISWHDFCIIGKRISFI
ncbi:hypothetical protein BsWGS_12299 [Bradybaena similaris]